MMEMDTEPTAPETPTQHQHNTQPQTVAADPVDVDVKTPGRQRQRTRRACYPCSKRKIKCDRDERTPCSNCAKRPHAELCTFDDDRPRSSRARHSVSTTSPTPALAPTEGGSSNGNSSLSGHKTPQEPGLRGMPAYPHAPDDRKPPPQHDSNTSRTLVLDPKPPALHKPTRYSYVPDKPSATPPSHYSTVPPPAYASAHQRPQTPAPAPLHLPSIHSQNAIDEIRRLLPPVKHVSKYCDVFHNVCNEVCPLDIGATSMQDLSFQYVHGQLVDRLLSAFEMRSMDEFRTEATRLALICAGIAAGVQHSDLEDISRRTLLRQYTAQTMQLLRIADVLSQHSATAYSALLILSKVLADELEPMLSWSVLGLTQRLPLTCWLPFLTEDRRGDVFHITETSLQRVRLRHEAFLGMMMGQTHRIDPAPFPNVESLNDASYVACLDTLAAFASRPITDAVYDETACLRTLLSLESRARPHLTDKAKCQSMHELTEYFMFRIIHRLVCLHYCQTILLTLRRPSPRRNLEEEYYRTRDACNATALECIEAYLDMLAFSVIPLRSWVLTTAALRAALIHGVLLADSAAGPTDAEHDRDRFHRLLDAFTNMQEESHADRMRWMRRYPEVFRRLQEMCDLLGRRADTRTTSAGTSNGLSTSAPDSAGLSEGTALRWMSQDVRDEIMVPVHMFRAYFSTAAHHESSTLGYASLSQQMMFGL